MNTYIVAAVTTNKLPTDPPAVTMFAVRAASERDAEKVAETQVVAPSWAIEARSLGDGDANVLVLQDGEVRQL